MTTDAEAVQLVEYLRDHRFIGDRCWADDAETIRDHPGYGCSCEVREYLRWESAMRPPTETPADGIVHNTYYQIRRLAHTWWRQRHGTTEVAIEHKTLFLQASTDTACKDGGG